MTKQEHDNHGQHEARDQTSAAKDLVRGMTVTLAEAAGKREYGGQTYFFCSTHCLDKF